MNSNLSQQIKQDLEKILGDDMIKVHINDDFDIPVYVSKNKKNETLDKKILVLSGGGIKGLAHIGVLYALDELKILSKIEEFGGTSVGSLIIGLYLVGYSPKEIWEFVRKFDLGKLLNINFMQFLTTYGLDDGKFLNYVLKRLIKAKGFDEEVTLRELYLKRKKKFTFTTVCWNTGELVYMNHENFPNLPVWKALRMSSAIPIFYIKIKHKGLLYMDGGCIDNYPIQLFKDRLHDVIGIYLEEKQHFVDNPKNLEEDLFRTYEIFNRGVNFGNKKGYERYTVDISLDGILSVNYNISEKEKRKIFMRGYKTIKKLIK